MSDRDHLKRQIGELGRMFLKRTEGEILAARKALDRVRSGDHAAVEELERFAHRIYGTGATLGFEEISEHAGLMERLAEAAKDGAPVSAVTAQSLADCMEKLDNALRTARTQPD